MEDTLGGRIKKSSGRRSKVLILVLMEDTLGVLEKMLIKILQDVLILVLMEDTLGVEKITLQRVGIN